VAIRDWDAQGTSMKALRLIGGQQAMLDGTYDVLLYDTPPNLEYVATGYAVQHADIALVVTSPFSADL
jgi:Mrp family chromosome partitioning ATPase